MSDSKFKKGLSLLLAIIMIFTMMPTTIFSLGADVSYPTMMQFTAASSADFHKYYNKVYSVTFLDKIDQAAISGAIESWDISAAKDGSVMAWMYNSTENSSLYDVYIAGEGGVGANPNSGFIFYLFTSLEKVDARHLHTDNATTFASMFENCYKLRKVDLRGWNTENVTDMTKMFSNCNVIDTLDLSSFDTSKVTTMKNMFYLCKGLKHIYAGEGWTTEAIANLYDGVFNCCYALFGVTEEEYNKLDYIPDNTGRMAIFKEDGGYITRVYNVNYVYTGEIPDGANEQLPESAIYKAGDQVTVSDTAFVDGYIFEGWTKDGEVIQSGTHFDMPEHDVTLYGYFRKPVEKMEISGNKEITLKEGKDTVIHVVFTPEDATNKGVDFSSSDETVVKVDENGKVTAVGTGTATITVISKDNEEIQITIDVTVEKYFVRYEYVGSIIPEGVGLPAVGEYSSGDVVTVEGYPSAEGYIFSGWDTDHVIVDVEGKFIMPEQDIVFKGSWTKIPEYKVTYEYIGDVIPTDAPEVPGEAVHKEGSEVTIADEPSVDGYTFSGWSTEDEIAVKDNIFNIHNDVHFVGEWEKIPEYTVTYIYTGDVPANAPELPTTESYRAGVTVGVKTAPTLEGYNFSGWNTDDASVENGEFTMPAKNVVIEGSWEKIPEYTVTYIYTGDVPANAPELPGDESYRAGVTVGVKTAPTLDGYNFSGWNTGDATVENGEFTMPAKNVVIKGSWEKIPEYKVTYEYIGDVIPTDAPEVPGEDVYKEGSEVTIADEPSVDGYTFIGWSTEDEIAVKDNIFNIHNDVHFVGRWEKIPEYTVTYIYSGDVPANAPALPDDESYRAGVTVGVNTAPTLDGYIFSGWNTGDATVENGEFTMPAKNVVIEGSWEKIPEYKVTYEYIGDVIPTDAPVYETKTYRDGTTVTVEGTPSVDGYIFTGWYTTDTTVTDGKFVINNDVKFVGKWERIKYDVTYSFTGDVPEGVKPPEKVTYSSGETVTVEGKPSVGGYIFTGWYTTDTTVTDGKFVINNDVKFVGKWERIKYDVTYSFTGDVPEGVKPPEKVTYSSGETVTVEAKPSVDGYIFTGWDTTDTTVTDGKFVINNNVKFVGKWEKIPTYTVTYMYTGNVPAKAPAVPVQMTYQAGATVTVAGKPSLPEYNFSGWKTDDVTVKDGKFVINKNVVLVGEWTMKLGPVTSITAPDKIQIVLGQEENIGATVNENAINKKLNYVSDNEAVVKVDADGNITTHKAGTANIYITSDTNPGICVVVVVTVVDRPEGNGKHYMVFGKTEKIGWYTVSFDGGKTFRTVFGNSNHVVDQGTEVIIKANDVFGDPFTFYINGKAVTPDENGYVRVKVDGYVLVGALGIPVIAPDGYEALNWFQRLIQSIKDFFAKIASWFKK